MPPAVFKSVREVSSEDVVNSASNLLQGQTGKKWRTKGVGEKLAYVILEFEESQQVTGIDIGNEHSAFVEVLVGEAACRSDDFTEILITCSFMTLIESKNSTNTNRVRCFNRDALVPSAVEKKWKMMKIVCTQPFNKHVPYGISFIKIHVSNKSSAKKNLSEISLVPETFLQRDSSESKEGNLKKHTTNPSVFRVGKFTLRSDSPDSESESTSGLFRRWKTLRCSDNADSIPSSVVANKQSHDNTVKTSTKDSTQPIKKGHCSSNIPDRNRECLLYGNDQVNDKRHERLEKQIEKERKLLEKSLMENEKQKSKKRASTSAVDLKNPSTSISSDHKVDDSKNHSEKNISVKRRSSPTGTSSKKIKTNAVEIRYRPFSQLLKGVILVISGIQNPERTILRNKALALGAKYKADWDKDGTHLICEYLNTPKYRTVKGKGKIITRLWIEHCFEQKKYLPWRRFALDTSDFNKSESDEEIYDESLKPKLMDNPIKANDSKKGDSTLGIYDRDDGCHSSDNSDSDTDDEIQRINHKNQLKGPKIKENKEKISHAPVKNVYEDTTDEEDFLMEKKKLHQ